MKTIKQIMKENKLKEKGVEIEEYDEKGNLIHYKDNEGYEYWKEYDEKGNEIHYKDNKGYEYWKEYDEKWNVINKLKKYSDGTWELNGEDLEKEE